MEWDLWMSGREILILTQKIDTIKINSSMQACDAPYSFANAHWGIHKKYRALKSGWESLDKEVFIRKNGFWNGINEEFSEWQQNYFKNTKIFLDLVCLCKLCFYLFFFMVKSLKNIHNYYGCDMCIPRWQSTIFWFSLHSVLFMS